MKTTQQFKFGNTAKSIDELADKVLSGEKTATSSLFDYYSLKKKKLSKLGDYISILNSFDEEVAVVRIVKMEIIKFKDISESFAREEGDDNLQNWIAIHEQYYSKQLACIGKELTGDTELVCEWFCLV